MLPSAGRRPRHQPVRADLLRAVRAAGFGAAGFGAAGFGLAAGLAVTLLMLGSPMVVHSYTEGGKPETLWYGAVTAILYLGFCGHTLAAAGLWSVLCLANLMAPLLAATVVGPALLAWAVGAGTAAELWLGAAPGLVAVALRFLNPGVGYLLEMVAYCRKMGGTSAPS